MFFLSLCCLIFRIITLCAQFHNDYESYFSDDALTKSDRKNKLIAAKQGVVAEVEKLKKFQDKAYTMAVALDEEAATRLLEQCLVWFA